MMLGPDLGGAIALSLLANKPWSLQYKSSKIYIYISFCRAEIVCPWGDLGAAYSSNCRGFLECMEPAIDVNNVLDTLGAGDTFNGSLIHAKLKGLSLEDSVRFACRIAGEKIQHYGYDCIKGMGLVSSHSQQVIL